LEEGETARMLLSKNIDKFDDKQKERLHNILATNTDTK
jgi:hypothetical protein